MKKALFDFEQKASSSDIALIYFSGHGMQVNNSNYMFPANTTATKPILLEGLVNLNFFIQSATSAKYGIVLVDACRNNPLIKYFQNGKHKGASAKKGLGQVAPTIGQIVIGFATSAGDTAEDGSGSMSPYAKALSVRLKESDDIRNVLGKVAIDVSKKYEQNPIYRANLAESVYLGGEVTPQSTKNITTIDGMMWQDEPYTEKEAGAFYDGSKEHGKVLNWENAFKYCKDLSLGGYNKWRLPSRDELDKLYQQKSKLKNVDFSSYWSATTDVSDNSNAWVVRFYYTDGWYSKSANFFVRCVRVAH